MEVHLAREKIKYMKHDNDLFYTCSLIEYIGRVTKNSRKELIIYLKPDIGRIYKYADVFHCEPIEKVADDFIERNCIPTGDYDNVVNAKYDVPSYWVIGEVFERLIEDISNDEDSLEEAIGEVFSSWLAERTLNFNSDLYYQPREYLAECYKEGSVIDA